MPNSRILCGNCEWNWVSVSDNSTGRNCAEGFYLRSRNESAGSYDLEVLCRLTRSSSFVVVQGIVELAISYWYSNLTVCPQSRKISVSDIFRIWTLNTRRQGLARFNYKPTKSRNCIDAGDWEMSQTSVRQESFTKCIRLLNFPLLVQAR